MIKDELKSFINTIHFAHIGYNDDNNEPNIKMVFCQYHKGISNFYISTNTSSIHVQQLKKNSKACLYIDNQDTFQGLMLKGNIIIHHDHEHKAALWTAEDIQYYKNGIDDEDYCVLEFVVDSGRYYSAGRSINLEKELFINDSEDKIVKNL